MSWRVLPWVYPVWDSLGFLDLGDNNHFPILGEFSTIISSSIFSWSFFLSSFSGTLMIIFQFLTINVVNRNPGVHKDENPELDVILKP